MAKSSKPMQVGKKMRVARLREIEYGEAMEGIQPKIKFIKWLRGKFGVNASERHGEKLIDQKVGKPYTRVQHRTSQAGR
jgi:hypothetical protein